MKRRAKGFNYRRLLTAVRPEVAARLDDTPKRSTIEDACVMGAAAITVSAEEGEHDDLLVDECIAQDAATSPPQGEASAVQDRWFPLEAETARSGEEHAQIMDTVRPGSDT